MISTLVMRFQECYKTIWNCVYNLDNFRDEETAKYFEKCSQSSKTTITMYEYDWEEKTMGVLGNDDDTELAQGINCSPGEGYRFFPIGDLGGVENTFITNLYHFVAARSNYEGGELYNISANSEI